MEGHLRLAVISIAVILPVIGYPLPEEAADDYLADDLVDRFWHWRLQESPEYGTRYGIHDYDHLVEEFTEESFRQQKISAETFLAETIELLQHSTLSKRRSIDLRILHHNLLTFIDGYEFRSYGMFNPLELVKEWLQKVTYMPKTSVAHYENILSRYRALPKQINDQIGLMRRAMSLGHTHHEMTVNGKGDLSRIRQEAETAPEDSSFYMLAFYGMPDTIPDRQRSHLLSEGVRTVKDYVLPTWARLYDFLSQEYMNHTRPGIGVSTMPGGVEYYVSCLNWHTTTKQSPAEVHQLGLQEVERISRQMATLIQQMGYNGTTKSYIEVLNQDENNFYETENAMLRRYEAIMRQVHRKLPRILKFIPRTNVTIRGFSSPNAALGYYLDPPPDGSKPGYFYANVYRPQTKAKFEMLPLTLHEAEPGHHTQTAYGIDMELPKFRTVIEFRKYYAIPFNWPFMTASIEGWALYAETLRDEMNLFPDEPLTQLGLLSSEIFRATRLVVDTGIHVMGWTFDQAKEYISNYTTFDDHLIEAEVRRYIATPAQACAYKIGELKLKGIRLKAEHVLGDKFDLKEFHHRVLSLGPAPIHLIEEILLEWIQEEKEKILMDPGSGDETTMESEVMVIASGEEITMYNPRDSQVNVIEFTEDDLMMNSSAHWARVVFANSPVTTRSELIVPDPDSDEVTTGQPPVEPVNRTPLEDLTTTQSYKTRDDNAGQYSDVTMQYQPDSSHVTATLTSYPVSFVTDESDTGLDSTTILSRAKENQSETQTDVASVTTEKPDVVEQSGVTGMIEVAEESGMTERVHMTQVAEETKVTRATEEVELTEKPEVAEVTEQLEVVEVTEPEQPQVTEVTEQPEVTEVTEQPEVAEVTEQPEVTEVTEQPEVAEVTEQSEVAEVTEPEQPGVTEVTEQLKFTDSVVDGAFEITRDVLITTTLSNTVQKTTTQGAADHTLDGATKEIPATDGHLRTTSSPIPGSQKTPATIPAKGSKLADTHFQRDEHENKSSVVATEENTDENAETDVKPTKQPDLKVNPTSVADAFEPTQTSTEDADAAIAHANSTLSTDSQDGAYDVTNATSSDGVQKAAIVVDQTAGAGNQSVVKSKEDNEDEEVHPVEPKVSSNTDSFANCVRASWTMILVTYVIVYL